MPYEFLPQDDNAIKVTGGTRAGLLVASLHGMFAVASSKSKENDEARVERSFSVVGDDFSSLIIAFLDEAARLSAEHNEIYDDVRFELATDKSVRGFLAGKPALSFGTPIAGASRDGLDPERTADNQWAATIRFRST